MNNCLSLQLKCISVANPVSYENMRIIEGFPKQEKE